MQKSQLSPAVILSFCLVLTGCNLPPSGPAVAVQDADGGMVRPLSAEVAETSALACLSSQQFLTLNDSGNPPLLYQLNANGDITATIQTDAMNQDWEALAIHQGQLWIADIGNNSGERTRYSCTMRPCRKTRVSHSG